MATQFPFIKKVQPTIEPEEQLIEQVKENTEESEKVVLDQPKKTKRKKSTSSKIPSSEDINYIVQNFKSVDLKELAERLDLNPSQIMNIVRKIKKKILEEAHTEIQRDKANNFINQYLTRTRGGRSKKESPRAKINQTIEDLVTEILQN